MKIKLLLLGSLLLFATVLHGQGLCKRTSIYFDLNKSELKVPMSERLDSLSAQMKGSAYFVELYGHTDTLASSEYNARLSAQRMTSVREYMLLKSPGVKFRFSEKNLGEENAVSGDPANDRRVDIFLIPVNGDKLLVGTDSEMAELPMDFFEPCGVCSSRPEMRAWYTPEEAAEDNIVFMSVDSMPLLSAGTVRMDFKPCDSTKTEQVRPVCIRIKTDEYDPEMTVWESQTVNGKILWIESGIPMDYDAERKEYLICGPSDRLLGREVNGDKPKFKYAITFPFDTVWNTFYASDFNHPKYKTRYDTLKGQYLPEAMDMVVSVGQDGDYFYLFKHMPVSGVNFKIEYWVDGFIYQNVRQEHYTVLKMTETKVRFRFFRLLKPDAVGYYVPEYNAFIPILKKDGLRKYTGFVPEAEGSFAYVRKDKLFVLDKAKAKFKFKKSKNLKVMRVNKRRKKAFKRNKLWEPFEPTLRRKKK